MEQESLKELERRCVQEELPYCQAACPLKVDGRAFCGAMGLGKFDEARKILSRAMPFPDLVGRLCDAPCERSCLRAERGGAVTLESHALDFSGDLYGKIVRLYFARRLRAEVKFKSVEDLVARLHNDADDSRAFLNREKRASFL